MYTRKALISLVAKSVHGQLFPSPVPHARVLHNYPRPEHLEMGEVRNKGARAVEYPRANTEPYGWIRIEVRHTWPVTLSQSDVLKLYGRSRVRGLGAK